MRIETHGQQIEVTPALRDYVESKLARLADMLKTAGVPVARRTVAKYREAMHIPSSQDRLRIA